MDIVVLNTSMLFAENLMVLAFVHKKGQLIRSIATDGVRDVVLEASHRNGTRKEINIGNVDILRKRADGKIPCDEDLQNEDEYRIEKTIKRVGCIPTFSRQFAESIGLNQTYRICNDTIDYLKFRRQLQNIMLNVNSLDITQKLHCTMMMASVSITDNRDYGEPGKTKLYIRYHGISYKEIKNTKAYTSETLLGQIGGFVGMQYRF